VGLGREQPIGGEMMQSQIDHAIVTRFNLPSVGVESVIRAKEGWLRGRVELFERYCLPSVQAQTNRNFRWIIYFDPESPEWLLTWIEGHRAAGSFVPRYSTEVSRNDLIADISREIGTPRPMLLTTNLDNDDALAVDFVERLQSIAVPAKRSAIYLTRGLIGSANGLYKRQERYNAFCSVIESWSLPVTCWVDWHNRLPNMMPVIRLGGAPGWLQVVHDTNVSNRVHGRLTRPAPYAALFPGLVGDFAQPGGVQIAKDRLVKYPVRIGRDAARALVKSAIVGIVGKEGLSRLKDSRAGIRDTRDSGDAHEDTRAAAADLRAEDRP
jgi:hypothetical protein